jgi:hypothetical protein
MERALVCLMLVGISVCSAGSGPDYFPIAVGNRWVYRWGTFGDGGMGFWYEHGLREVGVTDRQVRGDTVVYSVQTIGRGDFHSCLDVPCQYTDKYSWLLTTTFDLCTSLQSAVPDTSYGTWLEIGNTIILNSCPPVPMDSRQCCPLFCSSVHAASPGDTVRFFGASSSGSIPQMSGDTMSLESPATSLCNYYDVQSQIYFVKELGFVKAVQECKNHRFITGVGDGYYAEQLYSFSGSSHTRFLSRPAVSRRSGLLSVRSGERIYSLSGKLIPNTSQHGTKNHPNGVYFAAPGTDMIAIGNQSPR